MDLVFPKSTRHSARAVAIPAFISSGASSARTTSPLAQLPDAFSAGDPNVKASTAKTGAATHSWAGIPLSRRTPPEVPNPRELKSTVWATGLVSLPVPKSAPRSTTAPRCRLIQRRRNALQLPTIGIAFARKLLGQGLGHLLRKKCNRIGSPARQAFRSRTISASPTFSNAGRRSFLSHRTAFWKPPNDRGGEHHALLNNGFVNLLQA